MAFVADRIRDCIRGADTAARLGGDEFAILLERTGLNEGLVLAERVIATLTMPFKIGDHDTTISASIGIAITVGCQDAEDLLSNADVAMYRAKKEGGGRVEVFQPRMHADVRERLSMQTDLRRALPLGELWLQYQPLVRLTDRGRTSYTAIDGRQAAWVNRLAGAIDRSDLETTAHVLDERCRRLEADSTEDHPKGARDRGSR